MILWAIFQPIKWAIFQLTIPRISEKKPELLIPGFTNMASKAIRDRLTAHFFAFERQPVQQEPVTL